MIAAGTSNRRERIVVRECPICDGSIIDRGKFVGCDSWKSTRKKGCGVLVWKQSKGVPLSDADIAAEIDRQGREGPPVRRGAGKKSAAKKPKGS